MHVGGSWVPAASGAVIKSVDPTTEEVLGTVPDAGADDVAAVAAAREAAPEWAALGWKRRAGLLRGSPTGSPTRPRTWPVSTSGTRAIR